MTRHARGRDGVQVHADVQAATFEPGQRGSVLPVRPARPIAWPSVLHPVLGEIVAVAELMLALTIAGTALFGSQDLSDRSFRLLRWIGNRPEPPAPAACGAAKKVGSAAVARPPVPPSTSATAVTQRA